MTGASPVLTESVSVVVPVHNTAESLPTIALRVEAALRPITNVFELVLVNDGSEDRSSQVAADLARRHRWIRSIDLMRNYGQHNDLLCGIRSAQYDVVVTMDDDLQYRPEEIGVLLSTLAEGHDVVYGCPRRQRHSIRRAVASRAAKLLLRHALGADTATMVSAFRAFRTDLRSAFAGFQRPSVNIDVMLTWATTRFVAVPVGHYPRATGTSAYRTWALFKHALNMATGFSVVPLQVASLLGLVLTTAGVALFVIMLARLLILDVSPQGFSFVSTLVALLSGVQLLSVGVIGEYLARVHQGTMDQPAYVVRPRVEPSAAGRQPLASGREFRR